MHLLSQSLTATVAAAVVPRVSSRVITADLGGGRKRPYCAPSPGPQTNHVIMKSSGPSAIHQPSIAIPDPHSSGSRSVASSVISPVKNSKKQTTGQTIFHITIQIPEIGRLIMSWMSSDSGCVRWTDSLWTTTAL